MENKVSRLVNVALVILMILLILPMQLKMLKEAIFVQPLIIAAMGMVIARHLQTTSVCAAAHRAELRFARQREQLIVFPGCVPTQIALPAAVAALITGVNIVMPSVHSIIIEKNKYGILYFSDFLAQPSTLGIDYRG